MQHVIELLQSDNPKAEVPAEQLNKDALHTSNSPNQERLGG